MERFIKPTYDELESYVENLQKQLADAQATIAALQTRVKELEQIAISHDQSMRYITGQAKRTHEKLTTVQATLTQRTAECDTARRRVDELEAREVDVVLLREDLERRTAELEAAKRDLGRAYESEKSMDRIMRIEEASSRVMIDRLRAELERVRAALERIARYGNDGICPFGCDTPHIAQAALTATSQPAKPQGRMHACDTPGCVSCGNPEDATSQEGQR